MKINRAIKKTIILLLSMAIVFITAFACSCGWFKKPDNNGNGGNNGGEIVNPNPDPDPDPKPEDKPKPGEPHPSAVGLPDRKATEEEKILNFATGRNDFGFWAADGWSNNGMFNCTWSRNNAVISDGLMNMSITKGNDNRFYGAEYRTNGTYSYGYFATCMKPAKCDGMVSSLFTYTNNPVWDEIDIEFLGRDTTKVQFNYYTKGVGGHEYLFDLGFDASEGFHEYGFDWQKDCIVWYVDGKAVYKATKNIPSHPQQIMMNVWNGIGVDDWLKPFDESGLPVTAQYKWTAYGARNN